LAIVIAATRKMTMNESNRIGWMGSCALLAMALVASDAEAKLKTDGASEASFRAWGPAGMQIIGRTPDLSVSEDADRVKVAVSLARLTTGIDLRDHHMRDKYLEVGKFPDAELTVERKALKLSGDASADAPATLKLHGQSRAVTIHYTSHANGSVFQVYGTVHLDMTDYGIEQPSYLGVKVKPEVDITVHFDALDAGH
jgi:polyisoprenoid-binding protein YceI